MEVETLGRNIEIAGGLELAYQIGRMTMYRSLKEQGKLKEPGGKLGRRVRRNPNYTGGR